MSTTPEGPVLDLETAQQSPPDGGEDELPVAHNSEEELIDYNEESQPPSPGGTTVMETDESIDTVEGAQAPTPFDGVSTGVEDSQMQVEHTQHRANAPGFDGVPGGQPPPCCYHRLFIGQG